MGTPSVFRVNDMLCGYEGDKGPFFPDNLFYISPSYMSSIYEELHVLVNLRVVKFTKFGRLNMFSS